jgi:myo-inositol-1(or 4)-monophosphatase
MTILLASPVMDITALRKIGGRLRKEILSHLEELRKADSFGKGASGDVTNPIDKKAEDIVLEEVEKLRESVTIVSEECGFKDIRGGGMKLLLDPIDGSRNALSGIPVFSTSIAVVDGESIGDAQIGYVINLISGDEFWAIKGKGSYLNTMKMTTQQDDTLRVVAYEAQTPKVDIPKIVPLLSLFRRARCFGSTALDMAFLAQGAVSMFITPSPSRSFDFAAGYLLIKEAGGIVTDLKGKGIEKCEVGIKRITPLLASANEKLHKKALDVLKKQGHDIRRLQ